MLKFIAKPSVILSWVLISCLSVHISFTDQAFALRPPADLVSVAASDQEKRGLAEIQATSAVPKDKAKTPVPEEKTMTVLQGGGEENNDKKAREEEQNIMEEALALLEESEQYWKGGDLESALDSLDRAYALIIETNGDPGVARQKDDLRLLISKRILALYSSRQTVTVGKRSEVPLIMNADVEKEIRSFQGIEREFFISSYHRSGLHRPMIVRELKKAGLPEELSWLPLVESGFKISALSRARALGPWQFIPSTGYKYGLNRDEWIDERMDPEKSTLAAISYLKDLHNMFGDWLTVLAAYNCGEGRVLRVISGQHLNYLDRFWDLYHILPYETARYVPRFLATLHIVKNPEKFGMDLGQPLPVMTPHETVNTNKIMRLMDIAAALNVPEETLNAFNPELRHRMTPDRVYPLKVPVETTEQFMKVADTIQQWERPRQVRASARSGVTRHRVKRGETPASIAHRYGISVSSLIAYNGLSTKQRLRAGQRLSVPPIGGRYKKVTSGSSVVRDGQSQRYKVQPGDTLSSIARQCNTTPAEIRRLNHLKGDLLQAGKVIKVEGTGTAAGGSAEPAAQGAAKADAAGDAKAAAPQGAEKAAYTVQKGDTLGRISRKSNVSVSRLTALNNLNSPDEIRPGQVIVLR
jgi:membrane-bound lytic murein transglycosylase D